MRVSAFDLNESVPQLNNTRAFAILRPWIDAGRVGTLALTKLEKHVGAKELGKLERPGTFFDFTRLRPRTRIVDGKSVLTIPNSLVYYANGDDLDGDYIFLHLREPHAMGEEYVDAIVALLRHFDVQEYCRIGGMYDSVPHSRPLLLSGTFGESQMERVKGLVYPQTNTYEGPTSIVNLVAEELAKSGISTTSLMVRMPQYAQLDEDHMGAARLVEALCSMYGFPSSLADLERGRLQYQEINQAVDHNPEVKKLIQQLEVAYDRMHTVSDLSEKPVLSPEVEKFLGKMGERLEGNEDNE